MSSFRIAVPPEALADLRSRLESTRWPDEVTGDPATRERVTRVRATDDQATGEGMAGGEPDWSWGTPRAVLEPLVEHWLHGYDWSATQDRWNRLDQRLVPVEDGAVHVVRTGTPGATPLVLIHGWPDGFLRFEQALPLLADRFELIVPSIPGFGFSARPRTPGWGPGRVAEAFVQMTDALGLERFGVHGADLGSSIAEAIAIRHPDRVIGLHLGDVPPWHRYALDSAAVGAQERLFLDGMATWFASEGAYAALQRTKPQTLAYALTDSPVGLAAWIVEKLRAWSDCDGDLWSRFTPDEVIDDVMLYWVTGTAASAARYYRETALDKPDPAARVVVPTAFTIFPRDIACPPREYAERFFDVRRFTLAPRGGHFGPWEEPAFWADDVRTFFDTLLREFRAVQAAVVGVSVTS